jgi:glutathione S-transferase
VNAPLLLKGSPASPYTRKMLAVLRYRRIPYALVISSSARAAALPKAKVELLPTFYLPNAAGELEAVTDSTPLIRRFEVAYPGRQVRPSDPVLRFIDSLLEDYADEWLTKAMFHYRWTYAEDIGKASGILRRWQDLTASDAVAAELAQQFSRRQIDRLRFVGSNPGTAKVIEASYLRFLAAFEAHLKAHSFMLGTRPATADFGAYGQLTQLAHFDPTPSAIALKRAPRVYAWVTWVDDLSGEEPAEEGWFARGALPTTLMGLLAEAGRVYVPVMLANERAVKAKAEQVHTEVDGQPWVQNPFPYQAKCLGWLREEFGALGASDREAVLRILEATGCGALVRSDLAPALSAP